MTCSLLTAYLVFQRHAYGSSDVGSGLQGFQTPIEDDSFIVDGVGALGTSHIERGLAYVEVALSGHM